MLSTNSPSVLFWAVVPRFVRNRTDERSGSLANALDPHGTGSENRDRTFRDHGGDGAQRFALQDS